MDVLCFWPIGRAWCRIRVLIRPLARENAVRGYCQPRSRYGYGTMEWASVALLRPWEAGICTKRIGAFPFLLLTNNDLGLALQDRAC